MREARIGEPGGHGRQRVRQPQHPHHHARKSVPSSAACGGQLLPAGPRDRVELRLAVVVRRAPARRDPAALLQAEQRGVDRALIELQDVLADLLDAPGDAVAVQRPHRVERLQHHQIERALQDVGPGLAHV